MADTGTWLVIDKTDFALILQGAFWAVCLFLAVILLALSAGLAVRLFLWAGFA